VNVSDASGREVGRWAGKPPASACGSGSKGSWISVPISAAGLQALNAQPGAKLTVTVTPAAAAQTTTAAPSAAPTATSSATPSASSTSPAARTVLMVTAAANGTPQVDSQWPANGYDAPTLTPELIGSGGDKPKPPKLPPIIAIPGAGQPAPGVEVPVELPTPDPGGENQGQSNSSLIMPPWLFLNY